MSDELGCDAFSSVDRTEINVNIGNLKREKFEEVAREVHANRETCKTININYCMLGMGVREFWIILNGIIGLAKKLTKLTIDVGELGISIIDARKIVTSIETNKKLQKLTIDNLRCTPDAYDKLTTLLLCDSLTDLNFRCYNMNRCKITLNEHAFYRNLAMSKNLTNLEVEGDHDLPVSCFINALYCLPLLRRLCIRDAKFLSDDYLSFCKYISSGSCNLTVLNISRFWFNYYSRDDKNNGSVPLANAFLNHRTLRFVILFKCSFVDEADFFNFFFHLLPEYPTANRGVSYICIGEYRLRSHMMGLPPDYSHMSFELPRRLRRSNLAIETYKSNKTNVNEFNPANLSKCSITSKESTTVNTLYMTNVDEEYATDVMKKNTDKEKVELINCTFKDGHMPLSTLNEFKNMKSLSLINCNIADFF